VSRHNKCAFDFAVCGVVDADFHFHFHLCCCPRSSNNSSAVQVATGLICVSHNGTHRVYLILLPCRRYQYRQNECSTDCRVPASFDTNLIEVPRFEPVRTRTEPCRTGSGGSGSRFCMSTPSGLRSVRGSIQEVEEPDRTELRQP
jgi:hypothetical protein